MFNLFYKKKNINDNSKEIMHKSQNESNLIINLWLMLLDFIHLLRLNFMASTKLELRH